MSSSTANMTRTDIVRFALGKVGNTDPTTTESADAVTLLNAKIKELDEKGRWLWAISNTPTALTLVAGQRSYATGATATTIATNILELERVELVISATDLRPVRIVPKSEAIGTWEREVSNGEPYLVHLQNAPLMTNQTMHFFPTPMQAYAVQYYHRRRLYDFTLSTDNPDFPPGWNIKLINILAAELAPFYLPQGELTYHEIKSKEAIKEAKAANADKAERTQQIGEYF